MFQQYNEAMFRSLLPNQTVCTVTKQTIGDRCFFYCQFPEHEKKEIITKIAQRMSEFYFDYVKKTLIHKLISALYQSPYPEDLDEIKGRIELILFADQGVLLAKKECFARSVYQFLEDNDYIAIDGYYQFRTQTYQEWIRTFVQKAIDEYLLDREYQEFIQLLKYFVSIQRSRFIRVHVIHKDNKNFQLLKEDGTPILINELDKTFHETINQSFSGEDFIVGALLSTAPEQVVLHTNSPEENIIRTLLQIFDGRITICSGCQRCFSV